VAHLPHPEDVTDLLRAGGLEVIEHTRQRDAVDPALWRRADALQPADLCRLARAAVARSSGSVVG
jgi:hypothetical protein